LPSRWQAELVQQGYTVSKLSLSNTSQPLHGLLWWQGLSQHGILSYLNQANDLLAIRGILIVADTQLLSSTDFLNDFLAQAQRNGFEPLYQSCQARTTRFPCVVLQKQRQVRWQTTVLDGSHQQAIRDLFEDVFAEAMDASLWSWKYAQGRGVATGVWQDGRLVAHYGGMFKRLSYQGNTVMGIQIGDVMVTRTERGRLTRQGPFYLSATAFAEHYVGYHKAALIPYGFPSERHVRIARHLGIYAKVDDIIECRWIAKQSDLNSPIQVWKTVSNWKNRLRYSLIWRQMRREQQHRLLGIRDWAYIQHRYCQHPHKHYELLWVRGQQGTIALWIVHRDPNQTRLMDYIGLQCHLAFSLTVLKNWLFEQQIDSISGWFSRSCADCFQLADAKMVESKTDIVLPTIVWSAGPSADSLHGLWWLTTGDTDFL